MRNYGYEQKKVDQITARIPEARRVLRTYGIDPSSRLTLAQAAAATSTPTDELLAVLEFKARRAMRQSQAVEREVVHARTHSGLETEHEEHEDVELMV